MRVLLTGATGFIGSHVARELLNRGHEVHAVVRPTSDRGRLRDVESRIRFHVQPDFADAPLEPDLAIHLAWYAVPGKYLAAPENNECLASSAALLGHLGGRVVCAGTCFEYDTSLGRLREDSPTRPTSLYARTKDDLRRLVEERPDAAWVRFFYQFGPREDGRRLVPGVILSLLKGEPVKLSPGEQRRDYLHVEDVASAVCSVAESRLKGPVNIGSGRAVSVREIAGLLAAFAGRPDLLQFGAVPYYDGEPMLIEAENAKLRSTGWAPRYGLEAGLRRTFDWWRSGPAPGAL
jgi:nucleoside-diphosphate-sugar epimerase